MKPSPLHIGVIHSSQSIAKHIDTIRETSPDVILHASEGLEHALPIAHKMIARGVEVMMSRRGTAHILRENLNIPVISIPMPTVNIINALVDARLYGKKILLPCFRTPMEGYETIANLIDIDLHAGIYQDSDSLRRLIAQAKADGYRIIVGGGIATRIADEFNLASIELEVTAEAIQTCLESARSVARSNRNEKEKTEQYRSIIESVNEGIVSFDREGKIRIVNNVAAEALGLGTEELLDSPIAKVLPQIPIETLFKTHNPINEALHRIRRRLYIFDTIPIVMGKEVTGGITIFKRTKDLISTENRLRKTFTRGLKAKYTLADLKYGSNEMQRVVEKAIRFSKTDATILIIGETGTGKEILSQGIHNQSQRKKGPFVSINCATLPQHLLESELFGYEEGAFTGSQKGGKPGLFEMAHQGTILLDEIASTSQKVQSQLLRVLEEREVMRIGGNRLIPVDVRVIANSNLDLIEEALIGKFREDLFFRLNVLPIRIPPLRERSGDIPLLTEEFVRLASMRHGLERIQIPPEHQELFEKYRWPGNVRQLQHFVEQLVLLCNETYSGPVFFDLYTELTRFSAKQDQTPEQDRATPAADRSQPLRPPPVMEEPPIGFEPVDRPTEAETIQKVLIETRYNRGKAAKRLGICRATLWKKMKAYGL